MIDVKAISRLTTREDKLDRTSTQVELECGETLLPLGKASVLLRGDHCGWPKTSRCVVRAGWQK